QEIEQEDYRSIALTALTPYLSGHLRPEVCPLEQERHAMLLDVIPTEALQVARAASYNGDRFRALAEISAHLPMESLAEALRIALFIGDMWSCAHALALLIPYLPEQDRATICADGYVAHVMKAKAKPSRQLARLPEHFQVRAEDLDVTRAIKDE